VDAGARPPATRRRFLIKPDIVKVRCYARLLRAGRTDATQATARCRRCTIPGPDIDGLFKSSGHSAVIVSLLKDPERRRWLVFAVLAGAFLLVNVHRLSTAVLADPLARSFDATAAELGTLHAAFFYVYAPLQIVAGVLADRAGIRWTAAVGTVVMSVGGVLFALAPFFPAAFAARLLVGLGGSVVFIATLRFCANWFRPDEFATMSGVTVAIDRADVPLALPILLVVAATAAVCGFALVVLVGDGYLRTVGTADYTRLSIGVLTLLAAVSFAFAGVFGVVVFGVAGVLGLFPPRVGARRVHLMGVLIGPLIVG